jgi:FMN phosphatase YigB (HAD superfamily)
MRDKRLRALAEAWNVIEEGPGVKYLFLDFDDTVRDSVARINDKGEKEMGPPMRRKDVNAFPVGEAIARWIENGYTVVGTSNQRGPMRRREYVPINKRDGASLELSAKYAGKVMQETLNQLGLDFPVLFASDNKVFMYSGGKTRQVGPEFGQEGKKTGKAGKPNTAMGEVAFNMFGKPNREESVMVGDNWDGGDQVFAERLGFTFIDPGPKGKEFIQATEEWFGSDDDEEYDGDVWDRA